MSQEDDFRALILLMFAQIKDRVVGEDGTWTVKGFIDVYKNIYTISLDTKVLSKVLELLMFPILARFAEDQHFKIILSAAQNQYPDLSFVLMTDPDECYAVDIKSTFRTKSDKFSQQRVNGMTLGTYMGYFRTRDRRVSSTFAYNRYRKHYVLGVVYDRVLGVDERRVHNIDQLEDIPSVARNFEFFFHEKYRIASDGPGSGNTKNIGSTKYLGRLLDGAGVFATLGPDIFDDYWLNYRTASMAREEGFSKPPYTNLREYQVYKKQGASILQIPEDQVASEAIDAPLHEEVEDIEDL